jgi:hypothetical protein
MTRVNLAAYTAQGSNYPPYVSINHYRDALDAEDIVEIIVRSEATEDGRCGETASIKLTLREFESMLRRVRMQQAIWD